MHGMEFTQHCLNKFLYICPFAMEIMFFYLFIQDHVILCIIRQRALRPCEIVYKIFFFFKSNTRGSHKPDEKRIDVMAMSPGISSNLLAIICVCVCVCVCVYLFVWCMCTVALSCSSL